MVDKACKYGNLFTIDNKAEIVRMLTKSGLQQVIYTVADILESSDYHTV